MSCKAASPDIKPLILCLLSLLFLGRSMSFASLSCLLISFRFFFLFSFSCQRGRWRFSLFSLFYTLFLSHLSVERSVIDLFYSLFFFCILHNCTLFFFFLFYFVHERQLPVLSISFGFLSLPSFAGPHSRIRIISFLLFHPTILPTLFPNYFLCDLVYVCYSWSLWSSINKKFVLGVIYSLDKRGHSR